VVCCDKLVIVVFVLLMLFWLLSSALELAPEETPRTDENGLALVFRFPKQKTHRILPSLSSKVALLKRRAIPDPSVSSTKRSLSEMCDFLCSTALKRAAAAVVFHARSGVLPVPGTSCENRHCVVCGRVHLSIR
jgi:hypothetical protein